MAARFRIPERALPYYWQATGEVSQFGENLVAFAFALEALCAEVSARRATRTRAAPRSSSAACASPLR